jgi:phosphoribosylamine--glycine ligase
MKILLLGSGGREHALAWKINQSPVCTQLFIAPGNAGTESCGTNVDLSPTDFPALRQFALDNNIEMVVVGPEAPLVAGIYDFFQADESLRQVQVVGPSKTAALLEGSKGFAKAFMEKYGIPTAAYREFSQDDQNAGLEYIRQQTPPIVLKADGLAAGKGVLICPDVATAEKEFAAMLDGKFGEAGRTVVIEEFLDGIEFSVFVITDGKDYQLLPIAKDYKRIGEGDTGLNTGGMGAVSPVPFVDETLLQKVTDRIILPTLRGIQEEGYTYQGFIFFGLIQVDGDPYVIEYNCRMGDPETEVVIPRLQSDLVPLLTSLRDGTLAQQSVAFDPRAATTIFLVSGGYPEAYEKGKVISGLNQIQDSILFHAGTRREGTDILTNGGRVLAVTSFGKDFREALVTSNLNAGFIQFDKKNFRQDIGFDL